MTGGVTAPSALLFIFLIQMATKTRLNLEKEIKVLLAKAERITNSNTQHGLRQHQESLKTTQTKVFEHKKKLHDAISEFQKTDKQLERMARTLERYMDDWIITKAEIQAFKKNNQVVSKLPYRSLRDLHLRYMYGDPKKKDEVIFFYKKHDTDAQKQSHFANIQNLANMLQKHVPNAKMRVLVNPFPHKCILFIHTPKDYKGEKTNFS